MQALTEQLLLARGEAPGAAIWLMAIAFAAVCLIMMLVVLIQKPKGGGLSGAFGGGAGGGSSQAFIGGGVGNVLTIVTVVFFILFLLLACGMTLAINAGDDVPAEEPEQTEIETGLTAPSETEPTPEVPETAIPEATTPEVPEGATPETTTDEAPADNEAESTPATEAAPDAEPNE